MAGQALSGKNPVALPTNSSLTIIKHTEGANLIIYQRYLEINKNNHASRVIDSFCSASACPGEARQSEEGSAEQKLVCVRVVPAAAKSRF
jgi:hypothetical protein